MKFLLKVDPFSDPRSDMVGRIAELSRTSEESQELIPAHKNDESVPRPEPDSGDEARATIRTTHLQSIVEFVQLTHTLLSRELRIAHRRHLFQRESSIRAHSLSNHSFAAHSVR